MKNRVKVNTEVYTTIMYNLISNIQTLLITFTHPGM